MTEVKYEMKPVTKKREKTHPKKSIYDPMIDEFLKSEQDLVEITVKDMKPGYIVTQLKKRIETRKLNIVASHDGQFVYLETKSE